MNEAKVAVFFYGSYMNPDVLSEVGLALDPFQTATLCGFDIRIGPLANLVRADGRCVYGILTVASHAQLTRLYAHARDVLGGTNLPHPVVVETQHGHLTPALCYLAPALDPAPASSDYIDRIIKPARQHGFPDWYIARLDSFRPRPATAEPVPVTKSS